MSPEQRCVYDAMGPFRLTWVTVGGETGMVHDPVLDSVLERFDALGRADHIAYAMVVGMDWSSGDNGRPEVVAQHFQMVPRQQRPNLLPAE